MLASIGLDRTKVFISNTVFWRPPGNRNPNTTELATCMPFVERMLELIDPEFLVALGGPAASALLGQKESVGRLRGHDFTYQTAGLPRPVRARVMYHPAYLLRSPSQKRLAWRDVLALKKAIEKPPHP
jgi:DNA polymerase